MPVGIDEFEPDDLSNEQSTPEQVLAFLYQNRTKAFTWSEIATAVEAEPNTVGTALSQLKDRGPVRHRGNYWVLAADIERVSKT